MAPLFLTGTSGFVGRRVLHLLSQADGPDVRLLTRDAGDFPPGLLPSTWQVVEGTLGEPAAWSSQLHGVATVIHLAAATGNASRERHFAVNLEGTRQLLERAKQAGVRRFLFVSSIAVTYRERPHYHYAEAKARAEQLVQDSGLDWLIVRPTIVLGPGSPALESLRRLAALPIPVLFGKGEQPVQPIHVDDVARGLVAALRLDPFGGCVAELGGPEVVPLSGLLARIRCTARGRDDRRTFLRLPLRPIRALLAALEPVFSPLLPFTAGQLALFANPSVAQPSALTDRLPAPALGIAEMLASGAGR